MRLVYSARMMAEEVLADVLPSRWRHVESVAGKATAGTALTSAADRDLLVAAAWLHDVGYAPAIAELGFHALDGARWLLVNGVDERVAGLVAYHSCAAFEAAERGLLEELVKEFRREESIVADVLWWADMTTGPDGVPVDIDERLAEIADRYGPDHVVTRTWVKARPEILAVVGRVETALAAAGQPM